MTSAPKWALLVSPDSVRNRFTCIDEHHVHHCLTQIQGCEGIQGKATKETRFFKGKLTVPAKSKALHAGLAICAQGELLRSIC